jgi:general secretion pathway protein D
MHQRDLPPQNSASQHAAGRWLLARPAKRSKEDQLGEDYRMRRLMRPAGVVLLAALAILSAVAADKSKQLYAKGQDAEARQDYESAYGFFKQAYDLKPKDLRYRSAYQRTRFEAAASIVHRGQKLRDQGQLDEAVAAFRKALDIDPSLFAAKQELERTLEMINQKENPPPQAAGPPNALEKMVREAAGPVELAPISTVIGTLKLTDKADIVYRTIGQLAGVNVLFDPDYVPKQIKVELNGVTLSEALEIAALESRTFWRPVTPNTIFVAQDTPAKRKELEQSVLKTFYLTNLSQPTELQDVVNAIRAVLDVQRVQQLLSQNALVVRGTPDQIALAEKLVEDLDKARPEVIIDIDVMQISKDKSRTLGLSPPTSATVTLQSNLNNNTTTTNTTTGTTTPTTNSNGIELNTLGNLNATDFQVTIPSANLSAVMADTDTKMIQSPQIRALDNQKASLKIGERLPVATGSFQPGIGGVGINPLVNTQFQYIDVGVNIDVTPHIHVDRDVTMKISMEISSEIGQTSIGGITQPIIGQKKVDLGEIRLRDGETSLIGGIMDDSQTKSLSGIPGLAQIPILRYLFGQVQQDHEQDETVFAITPHIIRGNDINAINQRAIDIGTANTIELRHVTPPTTAPSPAAPGRQGGQAVPGGTQQPAQSAITPVQPGNSAGAPSFSFDPSTIQATKGNTFAVNLVISGAQNVYSVPVQLNYDPKILQLLNVSNGGFLSQDGQAVALVHREDDGLGQVTVTASRPPGSGGVTGQGTVVTLTFQAKATGQSPLTITRGGARDPGLQSIAVTGAQAAVSVQ